MVRDYEAAHVIVCMLVATTLAFLLLGRLVPDQHKRAFYLGLLSLAFSTSGYLYEIGFMPKSRLLWNLLFAAAVIAWIFALYKFIAPRIYAQLTAPLNLVSP